MLTIFARIKRRKSDIEQGRTIAKIHVSWDAARKLVREMAEKYGGESDPAAHNARDTLLGC